MCRLALLNKKGIEYIEKDYGLERFFSYLEHQLGGHGNGYALISKNGRVVRVRKGVDVDSKSIADDILHNELGIDFEWVIFHTRLASIGSICSANCHPFWGDNNGDMALLCANGTERFDYRILFEQKEGMTDTETVLRSALYKHQNLIKFVESLTAVYLGVYDHKIFAIRNYGSLYRLEVPSGAVVLASAFPYGLGLARPCDKYIIRAA